MRMRALVGGLVEVGTIADQDDRLPRVKLVGYICDPWRVNNQEYSSSVRILEPVGYKLGETTHTYRLAVTLDTPEQHE